MRAFRFAAVSLFMVFFLILGIAISGAHAGNYLGEFCWLCEDGSIMRIAITHMGNGHYLLNGKMTEPEGVIQAIHGNAEIVGDKVYITTNSTRSTAEETDASMCHMVLDLATLNGNMESLQICHDSTSKEKHLKHVGPWTLTFIPCPE